MQLTLLFSFLSCKKEQGHCSKIHGQERYLRGGLLLWSGEAIVSVVLKKVLVGHFEYADTAWVQRKKLEER